MPFLFPLIGLLSLISSQPPTYALGQDPTTPSQFSQSARIKVRATRGDTRPRRLILDDYLPPVGNQKEQGSCVGWSSAYYAYTYAVAKQRGLEKSQLATAKWQFSPAFIYHLRGKTGPGMTIYSAMELLKARGCATFAEMPYDDHDHNSEPPAPATKRAEKFKALQSGVVFYKFSDPNSEGAKKVPQSFDPETIKMLLSELHQPIVISIPVYEKFQTDVTADTIYTRSASDTDKYLGRHAIAIIGYDEDKKAFRMVNSWSERWGDKGQLWLSEEWLQREAFEGWIFIAGGGWARKKPGEKERPGENWQSVIEVLPPTALQQGAK